jgi:hypothetical protein
MWKRRPALRPYDAEIVVMWLRFNLPEEKRRSACTKEIHVEVLSAASPVTTPRAAF